MGCLLAIGFLAHVSTASGSSSFKPNPTEEEIKSALPPGWTTGLDEQGVRVYWKTPQYDEDQDDQKASHEDQSPPRQYYLHPRVMRAQKLMRQAQIINPQKPGYHPNPRKHVKPGVPLPPRPQMRYRDANTGPTKSEIVNGF